MHALSLSNKVLVTSGYKVTRQLVTQFSVGDNNPAHASVGKKKRLTSMNRF